MDSSSPLSSTVSETDAPEPQPAPTELTAAVEGPGEELQAALERFSAALTRIERAAARASGRDDAVRVQAMAITRLKRENEQLRAAQEEEARLRDATLAQVDRAMEAVERALETAAAPSGPATDWKNGDDAYGSAA